MKNPIKKLKEFADLIIHHHVFSVFFLTFLIFFSFNTYMSLSKYYSISEMDWNNDSETTISEFYESSDIRFHSIELNGHKCKEFFYEKSGHPIKVVCQDEQILQSS